MTCTGHHVPGHWPAGSTCRCGYVEGPTMTAELSAASPMTPEEQQGDYEMSKVMVAAMLRKFPGERPWDDARPATYPALGQMLGLLRQAIGESASIGPLSRAFRAGYLAGEADQREWEAGKRPRRVNAHWDEYLKSLESFPALSEGEIIERANIVAWLRAYAADLATRVSNSGQSGFVEGFETAADAIERGEHVAAIRTQLNPGSKGGE